MRLHFGWWHSIIRTAIERETEHGKREYRLKRKSGKKIEWKCVFCGGNVGLIARNDTKTVIGCDSCDMRIDPESRSDVF